MIASRMKIVEFSHFIAIINARHLFLEIVPVEQQLLYFSLYGDIRIGAKNGTSQTSKVPDIYFYTKFDKLYY